MCDANRQQAEAPLKTGIGIDLGCNAIRGQDPQQILWDPHLGESQRSPTMNQAVGRRSADGRALAGACMPVFVQVELRMGWNIPESFI
jgi:hypothetical protein